MIRIWQPWHTRTVTLTDRQSALVEHVLEWMDKEAENPAAAAIYKTVISKLRKAPVLPFVQEVKK